MYFTLEPLQALHGDSLILHYGDKKNPRRMVIDGGPATIYKNSLRPRLGQLVEKFSPGEPLPIELLMISHIDDDHINGILALLEDLADKREAKEPLPYQVKTLWHNAFNDILDDDQDELRSVLGGASLSPASAAAVETLLTKVGSGHLAHEQAAVVASVGQGQKVRDAARKLGIPVNLLPGKKASKDPGLVMSPPGKGKFLKFGGGLEMMVIGPAEARVKKLQAEWKKAVEKAKKAKNKPQALAAAYDDLSPFNLSSIVVVVKAGGKQMLLTGDARGDFVLEGLESSGLKIKGKPIHFDLLKLPHHGSSRNVEKAFFEQVTADHYVVSASGRDDNPDMETLRWIAEVRGDAKYTLHLTNSEGPNQLAARLKKLLADKKLTFLKKKLVVREKSALSLKVDLIDKVAF